MNITDFQDVSTQVVNGSVVFVASNSNVETKGADFDLRIRPMARLQFGLNGEYLDAYNQTFHGPHVRSPKWSVVYDARYDVEPQIAGGNVAFFGSVIYKSLYYSVPANVANVVALTSPSTTKVNVRVEYNLKNIKFSLTCRNCTNEYEYLRVTASTMGGAAVRYGYLNELRTITLDLKYEF